MVYKRWIRGKGRGLVQWSNSTVFKRHIISNCGRLGTTLGNSSSAQQPEQQHTAAKHYSGIFCIFNFRSPRCRQSLQKSHLDFQLVFFPFLTLTSSKQSQFSVSTQNFQEAHWRNADHDDASSFIPKPHLNHKLYFIPIKWIGPAPLMLKGPNSIWSSIILTHRKDKSNWAKPWWKRFGPNSLISLSLSLCLHKILFVH